MGGKNKSIKTLTIESGYDKIIIEDGIGKCVLLSLERYNDSITIVLDHEEIIKVINFLNKKKQNNGTEKQ